jgi:hypothetical protein
MFLRADVSENRRLLESLVFESDAFLRTSLLRNDVFLEQLLGASPASHRLGD